jgi:hypothetical protein
LIPFTSPGTSRRFVYMAQRELVCWGKIFIGVRG